MTARAKTCKRFEGRKRLIGKRRATCHVSFVIGTIQLNKTQQMLIHRLDHWSSLLWFFRRHGRGELRYHSCAQPMFNFLGPMHVSFPRARPVWFQSRSGTGAFFLPNQKSRQTWNFETLKPCCILYGLMTV